MAGCIGNSLDGEGCVMIVVFLPNTTVAAFIKTTITTKHKFGPRKQRKNKPKGFLGKNFLLYPAEPLNVAQKGVFLSLKANGFWFTLGTSSLCSVPGGCTERPAGGARDSW